MGVCVCGCGGEKVLAFPVFSVVGDETLTKDKAPKSPHISVRLVDNGVMKMEIFGGLQKGISGTTIINWSVCENLYLCVCVYVCEVGLVGVRRHLSSLSFSFSL